MRKVLSILLNNRSALNVYPLSSIITLGFKPTNFGLSTHAMLTYETHREVMHTLSLGIQVVY